MSRAIYLLVCCLTFSIASALAGSGAYLTVEKTLAKANKNILPASFVMMYNDQIGNTYYVQWNEVVTDWLPDKIKIVEDGRTSSIDLDRPKRYKGHLVKTDHSIGSLLTFSDHSEIMLSSALTGNVFISRHHNLPVRYAREQPYLERHMQRTSCSPDLEHISTNVSALRGADPSCKKVYLSITADYDLFLKKNRSTTQVTNYIIGVMNNVQAIYKMEQINIGISEIIIHQSPDAFRHLTALDDLNIFRFIRRSYNGHIALCLSGYTDATGFAPLGGHAFINALCNRSFSYAYVNVDGAYRNFPDYSWDIFGVTHELGHVIGSPHTHSCSWGPSQNETLDDCAQPEGPCSSGPSVRNGTLMSYCHLPGGPGINFSSGFGQEPGDLLRSRIVEATCLYEYTPEGLQPRHQTAYAANRSCSDGQFTHYYNDNNTVTEDDDILILSIDPNGQDIGDIFDGSLTIRSKYAEGVRQNRGKKITAAYVPHSSEYYVMNKYWEIESNKTLARDITIRLPFGDEDVNDLENAIPHPVSMNEIKAFTIKSPGTANPDLNHKNTTTARYTELNKASVAGRSNWRHLPNGRSHNAEFQTRVLGGYGMGAYLEAFLPVELRDFGAHRMNDREVEVRWVAENEINLAFYEVQRSYDGKNFQTIAEVYPNAEKTYSWIQDDQAAAYYRLRIVDLDHSEAFSATAYVEGLSSRKNNLMLVNNPVHEGQLKLRVEGAEADMIVTLLSANGQAVLTKKVEGQGLHTIDISMLPQGYYLIQASGTDFSYQETLIVTH